MPARSPRSDSKTLQPAPPPAPARVEVCPPCGWQRALPAWRESLKAWWDELLGRPVPSARSQALLAEARLDFADALADLCSPQAEDLHERIRQARSLRELWHLRSELFSLVSVHRGQQDAQARLAALNRHFPIRAAGSGFGALDSGKVARW
jgi:hypothetical protein